MKKRQLGILIAIMASTLALQQYSIKEVQAKENAKANTACVAAAVTKEKYSVEYTDKNTNESSNSISGTIKIKNTSDEALDLSKIKLYYFYTSDTSTHENFICDYAGLASGENKTANVKGDIIKGKKDPDGKNSDVLQLGFSDNSGSLKAGEEITVSYRVHRDDWSNYNQANDYSFKNGFVKADKPLEDGNQKDIKQTYSVSFKNNNTQTSTNTISGTVIIKNTGEVPLDLSNVKINYFYTAESNVKQKFFCDAAAAKNPYKSLTSSIKSEILEGLKDPEGNQSSAVQLTFDSKAGSIDVGQEVEVQYRICNEDWSSFDQSNDYSFNNGWTSKDVPVVVTPSVTPSVDYTDKKPEDAVTSIDYKGQKDVKLVEIVDENNQKLEENKQYTIDEKGNVILKSSYLSGLETGKHVLTYKFSNNTKCTVTLNIKNYNNIQPKVEADTSDFDKADPADIGTTIKNNGDNEVTLKSIKNGDYTLKEGKDYVVKDATHVVLNKSYLETLPNGETTFVYTFSNGKVAKVTITIKKSEAITLTIGKVSGKSGDTVILPVKIAGMPKRGADVISIFVKYDADKFDVDFSKCTAGSIIGNAKDIEFKVPKDGRKGVIEILYAPMDDSKVDMDGLLCNIAFKIKDNVEDGKYSIEVEPYDKMFVYYVYEEDATYAYKVISVNGTIEVQKEFVPVVTAPADFNAQKPVDEKTAIDYQGHEDISLTSITNGSDTLKKDVDYTVDKDGNVTLKKEYLGTLADGTYVLTYNFSNGTKREVSLKVINLENVQPTVTLSSSVVDKSEVVDIESTIKNNANNEITVKSIKNGDYTLVEGKDYVIKDAAHVVLNKSYLETLPVGQVTLVYTFSNGKEAKVTLTVKKSDAITLTVGNASGKTGDTVIVPVKISGMPERGADVISIFIKYDADKFDVDFSKCTAGSIIGNAKDIEFKVPKDGRKGVIEILYAPMDDSKVNVDGLLCKLAFKIKDTAENGKYNIEVEPYDKMFVYYVYEDDATYAYKVNSVNGTIVVQKEDIPTVTLSSDTFDKSKPENIEGTVSNVSDKVKLESIKNGDYTLKEGKDYIIKDASHIELTKEYLATLDTGDVTLTFNFSNGKTAEVKVVIKGAQENSIPTMVIPTITAKAGDTIEVPLMMRMPKGNEAIGLYYHIQIDGSKVEYVDCVANEELKKKIGGFLDVGFDSEDKVQILSSLFDNKVEGEFVIATLKLKVNSDLKSGDKIYFNVEDSAFTNSDAQDYPFQGEVGYIVIE